MSQMKKSWRSTEMFPGFDATRGISSKHRYVTFSLPSTSLKDRYGGQRMMEMFGAALVFNDESRLPDEFAREAMFSPITTGLFRPPVWGTYGSNKLVVGAVPVDKFKYSWSGSDYGIETFYVVTADSKFYRWNVCELTTCARLEKELENCEWCPHNTLRSCVVAMIQSSPSNRRGISPDYQLDQGAAGLAHVMRSPLFNYDRMIAYMKRVAPRFDWTFISPGVVAAIGDRTPEAPDKIQFNQQHIRAHFNHNELVARSEAAQRAADTRAALVRCEAECEIHEWCSKHDKPYRAEAKYCLEDKDLPGPFKLDDIHYVYNWFRKDIGARPPREIALIAELAGVSTRLFGYEMCVKSMSANMRDVDFYVPRDKDTVTYSYEDAILILRTAYREKGVYRNPSDYWGGKINTDSEDPLDPLVPDLFDAYTELCQHDYLKSYVCTSEHFGVVGWCEPRVISVQNCKSYIEVITHAGATRNASNAFEVSQLLDRRWGSSALPSIPEKYWAKAMAERGESGSQPSSDTPT